MLVGFNMPIYEYQCQDCSEELEVLQKISDQPLRDCPACGRASLKKKISAAAFRLKGGGWYETDFKTGDKKNLAGGSEGDGKGSAGDNKSASGKSDSAGKETSGKKAANSGPSESKKSA